MANNYIDWSGLGQTFSSQENAMDTVAPINSDPLANYENARQISLNPAQTPMQARQSRLRDASERNKAILGDKQALEDQARDQMRIASGQSPEQVQAERSFQNEVKAKSNEERIKNNIASRTDPMNENTFRDEELENAIFNMSGDEVRTRFYDNPELQEYILAQQQYATGQYAKTGLFSTAGQASVFGNLGSVGVGALGESASVIDWANYMGHKFVGSSAKELNKTITEGLSQSLGETANELQNTAGQLSDEVTEARKGLTDWKYDREFSNQKRYKEFKHEADQGGFAREADKVSDTLSDSYQVTKEIAQEIPDALTSLGVAAGITTVAKVGAKAFTKNIAEKSVAKAEARYVAKEKAKGELSENAIRASAGFKQASDKAKARINQLFAKKVDNQSGKILTAYEAIDTGAQNAVPAYNDSASFILNQDDKSIKDSKGFKDLQKENPNITVQDAKEILANKAGEEALLRTYFASATLGAVFSKAERKLFDRVFKGKSLPELKARAKSFGISVATEGAQEFGEEASSKLISNLAINNTLGYQAVDPEKDVLSSGAIGAISGIGSTTFTNAPELIASGSNKIIKNKLEAVKDKQETKINKQSAETINTFYSEPKDNTGSDGAPVFSGKYTDSSAYNSVQNSKATLDKLNINSDDDVGSIVEQLYAKEKEASKANDTDTLTHIAEVKANILDGIQSDIANTAPEFKQVEQMLTNINNLVVSKDFEGLNKLLGLKEGTNPEDTQKELNSFIQDAQGYAIDIVQNSDKYKQIQSTPLMQYLEGVKASPLSEKENASEISLFEGVKTIPTERVKKDISSLHKQLADKSITKEEASRKLAETLQGFTQNFYKKSSFNQNDADQLKDIFTQSEDLFNALNLPNAYKDFKDILTRFDLKDKANKDIFIGGKDSEGNFQQGLLTYLLNSLSNNGKLSYKAKAQLSQFKRSQTLKNLGILSAISELQNNNEAEPVALKNFGLKGEDKTVKSTSGKPVEFKSISAAANYLKAVNTNLAEFHRISDELLGIQNTNKSTEPANKSAQKESVEPVKEESVTLTDTDETTEDSYEFSENELDILSDEDIYEDSTNTEEPSTDNSMNPAISSRIIEAFPRLKNYWGKTGKNDATAFDTDSNSTSFTVGNKQIKIPRSALIELRRKGLSLTDNLLKATTKPIEGFKQIPVKDFITASDNTGVNSAITDLGKSFNKLISELPSVFKPTAKLNPFFTANGFLNLYETNAEGKLEIPASTRTGLFKAIVASVLQQPMFSYNKQSVYTDYWNTLGSNWTIQNTTEKLLYNGKPVTVEDFDVTSLGQDRSKFISMLGSLAIKQLGLEFNHRSTEYSDVVRDGLEQSLGIALLNMMMKQGLLQEHTVQIYEGNKLVHSIPYVNFTSNISTDISVTLKEDYLLKPNTYTILSTLSDSDVKELFSEPVSDLRGVTILNKQNVIGSENSLDLENTNTKNKFTSSNSAELKENIATHNNVKFTVNSRLYDLLSVDRDAVKAMLGYEFNVDKLKVSDATKKSIKSRNNAIERSLRNLDLYVQSAKDQGIEQKDILFQFNHKVVPNMRVMMDSTLSPQSDKIVREMLNLFQTTTLDNGESIEGELDLTVKLPKSTEPRSIRDLVSSVTTGKGLDPEFSLSFMLALAQALDVTKLEKVSDNQIMKHLVKALTAGEHSDMFSKVIDGLWLMQIASEQKESVVLPKAIKQAMKEFGEVFGTDAPRAMNALSTLANFMYLGTNKDPLANKNGRLNLDTSLNIESDGISNGGYNITRQFVASFSANYLDTIKRTGTVTLDVLSQLFSEQIKQRNSSNLPLEDKIAGSATLFGKESGKEELLDIYEVIAKQLAEQANTAIRNVNQWANANKYDLSNLNLNDFSNKSIPKEIAEDIRFLVQMQMTGHLKSTEPVTSVVFASGKNVTLNQDFLIEVKRNLAKSGVTPKVYGSMVKGVAQQLTSDIKNQIRELGDSLISLASRLDSETDKDSASVTEQQLKNNLTLLSQYGLALGVDISKLAEPVKQSDVSGSSYEQRYTDKVNKLIDTLGNNSKTLQQSLMSGLAKRLNNAVNETFKEEFGNMQYAIIQDSFDFTHFIAEFKDNIQIAMNQRNKRKGYAPNDPRNADPLTRKEYVHILKQIASTPAMATAFATNATMLEDVITLGNSIIDTVYGSKQTQTTLTDSFENETPAETINNISNQLMSKYRDFSSAGASNTTSTVPSTESKSQALLLKALRKLGLTSLDVYDGTEIPFMLRNIAGKLINKATNEVHLNTNIFKAFYDRFKRSGITDAIIAPQTLKVSEEFLTKLGHPSDSIKDASLSVLFKDSEYNLGEIKYLMGVNTLVQMKLQSALTKQSDNDLLKEDLESAYKEAFRQLRLLETARDTLLAGSNKTVEVIFTRYSANGTKIDMPNVFDHIELETGSINYKMSQLLNDVLYDFASKVANNQAIKAVESKYLPAIVNQFGGGNRGYFFNQGNLDALGKRFLTFIEDNYGSQYLANNDLRLDSEALSAFLNQDAEIQKEYQKVYNATMNKLNPSVKDTVGSVSARLQKVNLPYEDTKEFKDNPVSKAEAFYRSLENAKSISEFTSILSKVIDTKSVKGKFHKVILNTIDKQSKSLLEFTPDRLQILVGRDNFINWLNDDISLSEEERTSKLKRYDDSDALGYFDAEQGIIVVKESWARDYNSIDPNDIDTILHELLHAINHGIFNQYYTEEYQDSLNQNKNTPVARTVRQLEDIALTFAKKFSTNKDMYRILADMAKLDGDNYHYATLDSNKYANTPIFLKASANILYYFDQITLDDPSTYPTGWSKADVLQARRYSLDEFLAFASSEPEFIERLNAYKDTVISKQAKGLIDSIIDTLKNLRKAFYEFMGLNQKDYPKSLATALMQEYFNIGETEELSYANMYDNVLQDKYPTNATKYLENLRKYKVSSGNMLARKAFNNPNNHINYLGSLEVTFASNAMELLQANDIGLEYPEGFDVIDALKDNHTPTFIANLRTNGLSITTKEEDVAKLVNSGLKITETLNPSLYSEALSVGENLISLLPALKLSSKLETALLALNPNEFLATAITSNTLLKAIDKLDSKQSSKIVELVRSIEDKLVFGNSVVDGDLKTTLQQLGKQILTLDTRNKLSESQRNRIEDEELQKEEQLLKAKELFDEVKDKTGEPIHTIMEITSDAFSGRGLAHDGSDANSAIGTIIRDIIRNHELLKGRPTLATKLASWFLGLDFKGGYVADLVGQRAFQTEAIRERLVKATNSSIRKQFQNELSEEQERAINAILNKTKLNNLKLDTARLERVLHDDKARAKYIQEVQDKLSHSLVDMDLSQKQIDEARNVYLWQVQGLAELNQTGYAKSGTDTTLILPNINSILGSDVTKALLGEGTPSDDLVSAIKELYTLYSLDHAEQDSRVELANLIKDDPKGVKALLDSVDTLDREVRINDIGFFGKENFEMYKSNPNKDIQIIPVNDSVKLDSLRNLGYEEKMRIDNGKFIVMYTDMSVSTRFTTGVLGLAEETINGENLLTGKSINEISSTRTSEKTRRDFITAMNQAKKDSSYYSKLKGNAIAGLTVSEQGVLTDSVKVELPAKILRDLVEVYDEGINALGNYHGRMMEEYATQQNNKNIIDKLVAKYEGDAQRRNYILFDGKYKPKGNSKADIEFANRINGIYRSLPTSTKLYIEQLPDGLHIDLSHVNNLLGYQQASVTDLYTGKSGLPESVQNTIKKVLSLFSKTTGFNPVKSAKHVEQAVKEVTSLSRDVILNRSGVVAAGNLVSNVIHLWNTGMSHKDIAPYMAEGLKEVKEYSKTLDKSFEIDYLRKGANISKAEKLRLDKQFEFLTKKLEKSPVAYLVKNGVLTSVQSIELKLQDNPDFSLIKQLQDKTGINKLKETSLGKVWGEVMIHEGSKTHDFMNQALDYGDFVAKYALFKHLTNNRQFSKERALRVIQDEFINYQLNRGREFDWLNATGLTWFLSYKLGIQKIIMRNLRRNFLRSIAVYEGGSILVGNNVVPKQNLIWDGSLDYQLSPSNIYKGFESHWLMQAVEWLSK